MAIPNHEAKDLDGLIGNLKEAYDEIVGFLKAGNSWPFKFDSRVIIDAANRLDAMHDMLIPVTRKPYYEIRELGGEPPPLPPEVT